MKTNSVKILLPLLIAVAISACQKPAERTAVVDKKIADKIIPISDLQDVTSADYHNKAQESRGFLTEAIEKISDEAKKAELKNLLQADQLTFLVANVGDSKKLLILKILNADEAAQLEQIKSNVDNFLETNAANKIDTVYAIEDLTNLKNNQALEKRRENSISPFRFKVVAELKIKVGILENALTDYNEKKSVLTLTETDLSQAKYILVENEIKSKEAK
ncbi:MAG: hypothetical protein ACK41T_05325 [Pseudobdellovibrio sp.]